jgi:quercetin dioxygenase-like cupin family protein
MFYRRNDLGYRELAEGMRLKTLVHGAKTLLSEFRLEGGRSLPSHRHPHEQTGYLVSGRLRLIIGDQKVYAEPGDSWCIQGDVVHGAEILEDSVVVEVFSPVREDYLP